jgi:hypothetical protein
VAKPANKGTVRVTPSWEDCTRESVDVTEVPARLRL